MCLGCALGPFTESLLGSLYSTSCQHDVSILNTHRVPDDLDVQQQYCVSVPVTRIRYSCEVLQGHKVLVIYRALNILAFPDRHFSYAFILFELCRDHSNQGVITLRWAVKRSHELAQTVVFLYYAEALRMWDELISTFSGGSFDHLMAISPVLEGEQYHYTFRCDTQ